MISKKHKKVCRVLNYTEHLLILTSTVTGCVSICALISLDDIPESIASSAITIKISVITAGIIKSIIKKKKHDNIVLLAKTKLDTIKVVISKALVDPNVSRYEFVSVNNVLKEYYDMKEEFKNFNNK